MIEFLLTIPKELQVIIPSCIVIGVWYGWNTKTGEKWQQKDKKD
jgi:hypothetical protein|tara:strand:- start:2581 stop:2712 length:132 start_codon:yes stop_codon:yes gene_type:complete